MHAGETNVMHLFGVVFALMLVDSGQSLTVADCGVYYRRPEYTDISVDCGTTAIQLAVQACPVVYTGYNESLLLLNGRTDPGCGGTLDTSVMPPVVRFQFPLNQTNSCGSEFTTTGAVGTGVFSDFSNIQTVNISGLIRSFDPTVGQVTYNAELKYLYSCSYALEYLINNTKIEVSSASIAVKDNNGSFISTLSMQLYEDRNYTTLMVMSPLGIELKTNIYVLVKATNLTSQYNVLLDRCYASMTPHPHNSTFFNLFVACNRDKLTTMLENGQSQNARFTFPAFRFVEQQNQTVATYFLHCITRLCEKTTCAQFQNCRRRKRDVESTSPPTTGISDSTTITSPPIVTRAESVLSSKEQASYSKGDDSKTSTGLGIAVGILVLACIGVAATATVLYKHYRVHSGVSKPFHS
ncbi:zona pellucida-like domain-containing protein 1 [Paramormyrops kingsleyae]|uniref:zona pellucida-like domain-containing protein 1 n=1 Tax=Paramormyrops kingsleyae TaxID=1676925 RepID=UPI003B96ECB4